MAEWNQEQFNASAFNEESLTVRTAGGCSTSLRAGRIRSICAPAFIGSADWNAKQFSESMYNEFGTSQVTGACSTMGYATTNLKRNTRRRGVTAATVGMALAAISRNSRAIRTGFIATAGHACASVAFIARARGAKPATSGTTAINMRLQRTRSVRGSSVASTLCNIYAGARRSTYAHAQGTGLTTARFERCRTTSPSAACAARVSLRAANTVRTIVLRATGATLSAINLTRSRETSLTTIGSAIAQLRASGIFGERISTMGSGTVMIHPVRGRQVSRLVATGGTGESNIRATALRSVAISANGSTIITATFSRVRKAIISAVGAMKATARFSALRSLRLTAVGRATANCVVHGFGLPLLRGLGIRTSKWHKRTYSK